MRDTSVDLKQFTLCYRRYVKYRCDYGHCEDDRVVSMNTKDFCNMSVLGW